MRPSFGLRSLIPAAIAAASIAIVAVAQPADKGPVWPATVEATMERVDDTVDRLVAQLDKPGAMPDALKNVWEIERLALHAKTMTPEHLKGGATPEVLTGYRKAQIQLMTLLLQLEGQVIDNKPADAKKTLDAINALRKESHNRFKAEKPGK
jgi:hypothetical protein